MDFRKFKPVTISAAARGYKNALGSGKPLTAQEKFKAGQNIYANKVGYTNQANAGKRTAAEGFRYAAAPSYSALEQGGAKDVADTLHSSDVATAGKVLSGLAYDAYEEKYRNNSNKAIDNIISKATAEYDSQKAATDDKYDALARQGYLNYMEAKKGLPQQLKAQGMTGGLSESSQIALKNSYGQQLSDNERARLQELAALDTAKTGAILDAENKRLDVDTDLAAKEYERYLSELGYDRQDAQLDKQLLSQRQLQQDSQNWQSGEARRAEAHDLLLLDKENQNLVNRDATLHGYDKENATLEHGYNKEILGMEQTHDASENEKTRRLNVAIELADSGNFRALAELTGYPVDELEKNYKNRLWWEAAFPQYAEKLFPNESYIHHVSGSGGSGGDGVGNAPNIVRPF